jgi:hypothetical protein
MNDTWGKQNAWPEQQPTQWPQQTGIPIDKSNHMEMPTVGISDGRITIIENDQHRFPTADDWSKLSEDQILMLWKEKQEAITAAKNEEMELRKHIVARAFPERHEGMNTKDLGEGYQLKAGVKFNYTLADNDTVEKCLDRIAKIGNQGAFIADRLVSWKPSFLLTEYRVLQEEKDKGSQDAALILKEITTMLTIDDAAPSLEIKPPPSKKK